MSTCPFLVGSMVAWTDSAPATWRSIYTPDPMQVISVQWYDGSLSEFEVANGVNFERVPGWIIEVAYDPDSTSYYDPPRSILLLERLVDGKLRVWVHEKWLKLSA